MKVVPFLRRFGVAALFVWGTAAIAAASTGREVVVVPLSGRIDSGTARLIQRSVEVAQARNAVAIVLDVGNAGGSFAPADVIREALAGSRVPVIAYIHGRADAGAALVALGADRIVVAPQASIGSAEPVPPTNASIATVRSAFESAAQRTHRSAQIAAAMVDRTVDVPQYKMPVPCWRSMETTRYDPTSRKVWRRRSIPRSCLRISRATRKSYKATVGTKPSSGF